MSTIEPLLLRAAGTALILEQPVPGTSLPQVLHWGSDPGALEPAELSELAAGLRQGVGHNSLDVPSRDRKSTRLNSSHTMTSRMPSSA